MDCRIRKLELQLLELKAIRLERRVNNIMNRYQIQFDQTSYKLPQKLNLQI